MKKFILTMILLIITSCTQKKPPVSYKPVIYLYPEAEEEVHVELQYNGTLTVTYPSYNDKWDVLAYPDGKLINLANNKEYSYLFWEGEADFPLDIKTGFVVEKADYVSFLQEKLEYLGLTPEEYNEFIVYWLPILNESEYSLISFENTTYLENTKLNIVPEPDSVIRVYMTFKHLDSPVDIPEDILIKPERNGFTVVEWGGSKIE